MFTFNDADLGQMMFDGSVWVLERRARFNGVEIPVRIEPEDATTRAISPAQRRAAELALMLPSYVLERAAPAVVQNYEVYREMLGDEDLPPLRAPVDVWQSVKPTSIDIPAHGGVATATFLLLAECDWDPEHGLAVRFRNGRADAANQQGEIGI